MKDTYVCSRCYEGSQTITMSRFNTQMICKICEHIEQQHPLYSIAREIEAIHIRLGNLNFAGIGLPNEYEKHVEKFAKPDQTGL